MNRETRRARVELAADDYSGPGDWRPEPRHRSIGVSLAGVLVAGLVILMLVVAVYFLLPGLNDVREPSADRGVRVPIAGGPAPS